MSAKIEFYNSYKKTFSQSEFDRFADLSQDDNPIHVDQAFAKRTKFGSTVAHGMLIYGLICRGISEQFPTYIHLAQELIFPSPTHVGELLTVTQEISNLKSENERVEIATKVIRPNGEISCESKTLISSIPKFEDMQNYDQDHTDQFISDEHYKGMILGQTASHQRKFNKSDLQKYRELSGDTNRHYEDLEFSKKAGFNNLLIPNPLLGCMFSHLLGTKLPGRGTNWLKLNLTYLSPIYIETQITAQVKISRLRPEKNLVNFELSALNSLGDLLSKGGALVLVQDIESTV